MPPKKKVAVNHEVVKTYIVQPTAVSFPFDTTIYHEKEDPRVLKAGDFVPEGWTTEPGTLSVSWRNKPDGTWYSVAVSKE